MGLEIYRGRKDYPVKAQLYYPVYSVDKEVIDWQPSEIFIWCREIEAFGTETINNGGRLIKAKKGALETIYLKEDEITPQWKIMYNDTLYFIDRMTQQDDNIQQVMMRNCIITTRLYLKG